MLFVAQFFILCYNRGVVVWRRTEEVATGRTRNAFVGKPARGFESHRLRQKDKSILRRIKEEML